jgi:hypothetical protein
MASLYNLSWSLSSRIVSTFRNSETFLASAVLRKVGLLINSRMRETGRTVSPQAPQQARIGYPRMQKKAMMKQIMVELN